MELNAITDRIAERVKLRLRSDGGDPRIRLATAPRFTATAHPPDNETANAAWLVVYDVVPLAESQGDRRFTAKLHFTFKRQNIQAFSNAAYALASPDNPFGVLETLERTDYTNAHNEDEVGGDPFTSTDRDTFWLSENKRFNINVTQISLADEDEVSQGIVYAGIAVDMVVHF